jgi:hypothetical protein
MPSFKEIETIVDRLRSGQLPLGEVRSLLRYPSPIVRANALDAIAVQAKGNDDVIGELLAVVSDPANQMPLMGTVSVAHLAIACLLRLGTPKATEAANQLIMNCPEPERTDLIWYLKSEGLLPT